MRCDTCRWHDDFSCACCNGLSVKRGDFTDIDDYCDEWEARYDGCGEVSTLNAGLGEGTERKSTGRAE